MNVRVAPLERDDIDAAVVDRLCAAFPRAGKFFTDVDAPPMPPVLGLLARHPALAGPWLAFSGAVLDGGVLDARTRELLVLATADRTGAVYIWNEHLPMAAAAGISPIEVDAVAAGAGHSWSDADAALFASVDDLVRTQRVSDETWAVLADHFDDQALLEVLFVVGTYTCLAMVLNSTALVEEEPR